MSRFISKIGKIVKSVDEARAMARKREEFSGALVSMMDGGKGRRYAGKWNVKYDPDKCSPEPSVVVKTYTVYSYGDHWPMYVWDDQAQMWYGNGTKCWSRTTVKHMSQISPGNVTQWVPMDVLQEIASKGVAGWVREKVES